MKFDWNQDGFNIWLFIWIATGAMAVQILRIGQNIEWVLLSIIIYLYSFRQWEIVCGEKERRRRQK